MEVCRLEILTIKRVVPHYLRYNIQDPLILIREIKKIVKDLKKHNSFLKNYRLMDVGFTAKKQKLSHMNLYFKKEAL